MVRKIDQKTIVRVVYFISSSLRPQKQSYGIDCEVCHDPSEIAQLHLLLTRVRVS